MKNIWSVEYMFGSHERKIMGLTKKQAKEAFGKLAAETTKNIHNDYIDFMSLKRCGDAKATMERVGKLEYSYWIGKEWTLDGGEAALMVGAI